MRPEEQLERAIELRDLVAIVHQQAAQRGGDVGAAANVSTFERAHRVEQPSVVHVEPRRAQQAAEQKNVGRRGS